MGDRTERSTLRIAVVATVLAWGAWLLTVVRMDPTAVGWVGELVFDGALGLASAGSATVVGILARRRDPDHARAVRIAVRQGALVGIALALAVFLQARNLLSWMNFAFLIIALTILELFLISVQRKAASG